MSKQGKNFYEFGPFRVDPEERLLWRGKKPVPLKPKVFETLLVLVQRGEGLVLKDDLMKSVWPDTFVEESNLAQNIFVLRKALGDTSSEQRYIVTVPGRGYRFVQRVRTVPAVEEVEDLIVETHSRSRVVIEEAPSAGHTLVTAGRRWIRPSVLLAALGVALVAAMVFRPTLPPPRVSRIRQITQIGTVVHNTKLLTDGPRIYFRAFDREGKDRELLYVSRDGGEAVPLSKPLPRMDVDDISADGTEFLVVDLSTDVPHPLWRVPVVSGSPQPVGQLRTRACVWSPGGDAIAHAVDSDLYLVNPDGSNSRKVASLPGEPVYLRWSPDGRALRFSLLDPKINGARLWEADLAAHTTRDLLPDWETSRGAQAGGWTPDGRYFFFSAVTEGARDIWALRERGATWRRIDPRPVQLTQGPLAFYQPTPSKDGKSIFAVGETLRGQLLRYDADSAQFVPFANGISADHVAFSPDAQWMAYVEFPDGNLIRSRLNGSERLQLSFHPMRASNPQWAPDGARLAFQASPRPGAPEKIYLISRDGGPPVLAAPNGNDWQAYPSWAADEKSILYSSSDSTASSRNLARLDLRTQRVSALPGTVGLRYGQISPDGRRAVALQWEKLRLVLYDMNSHSVQVLANDADYPHWSQGGEFAYFRTPYFSAGDVRRGIFRWSAATGKIEQIVAAPDFSLTGLFGIWSGVTPDGSPLVLRDLGTRDLYRLDLDLP
ncbi:MAG TPA: winged helix-turn-helix domain-containing protein [Terriglobia bacterium]|nr:winged helix-turn-helix domain-containing protein [Terriglobia bacterium]